MQLPSRQAKRQIGQLDGTYWMYQRKDLTNAFQAGGPDAWSRVLEFHGDVSPASPMRVVESTRAHHPSNGDDLFSVKHYNAVGGPLIDPQPPVRQSNVPVMEVMDFDLVNHELTLKNGDGPIVLWQAENTGGFIRKIEVLTHY